MKLRLSHPLIKIFALAFSGMLLIGSFLDAVSNSISVVTPRTTYTLTPVIIVVAAFVHFWLKNRPFTVTKDDGQIEEYSGLNHKAIALLLGVVMLLWIPRFISSQDSSSNKTTGTANANLIWQEESEKLDLDVWLHEDGKSIEEMFDEQGIEDRVVSYLAKAEGNRDSLDVEPHLTYLDTLYGNSPIEPIFNANGFFYPIFPTLDFKMVNNSKETVFATKVVLEIEKSVVNPLPLILVERDPVTFGGFRLVNDGWGTATNVTVKFRIQANGETPNFQEPFPYIRNITEFDESVSISLIEELKEEGIDIETISRLYNKKEKEGDLGAEDKARVHQAQGEYGGNDIYLDSQLKDEGIPSELFAAGVLSFSGNTHDNNKEVITTPFIAYIPISFPELGAAEPPTMSYDVLLGLNKNNYEIVVPISHSLKPGEADRFLLRLGALKSSVHRFRAKVIYNDGRELNSKPIRISLMIPRSAVSQES